MIAVKSFRARLMISAFSMAIVVCAIFSAGLFITFEVIEDALLDAHLRSDVDTFMAHYEIDPRIASWPRHNFGISIVKDNDTSMLPDYLRDVPPGDDDVFIDGKEYDLVIRQRGNQRFYFTFGESKSEEFEQQLLIGIIIVVLLVLSSAIWLSFILGKRIAGPITDLSRHVAQLDDNPQAAIQLDLSAHSHDEIALLTTAIDGYHARISGLLRREREFSSDVSHELRTPLMAIHGAAELLAEKGDDDKRVAELAARVKRGCVQMTTLTEALLFLAREPASFKDMIEPVSVKKVIADQVRAVQEVTKKKGIKVNVEQLSDETIHTIPAVINIVIGNILQNAVKYTDKNVINIFVTKNEVVIQDYGPGIDKAVQATLFDRYNRGANRNPDGTGIGLALVRRFCDQYGWRIDFYSEENKGTRVALVL